MTVASAPGVPFEFAAEMRKVAAQELFEEDPRAFSIGIGLVNRSLNEDASSNWGFHVLSERVDIRPGLFTAEEAGGAELLEGMEIEPPSIPKTFHGVPVLVRHIRRTAEHMTSRLLIAPSGLPASRQPRGSACEQKKVRPLVCGLQVQNPTGGTGPGSIGCFVLAPDGGGVALLSNNHVLAASNRGATGDAIHQPSANNKVASLLDYPKLLSVPDTNNADIALAGLEKGTQYSNEFHPRRHLWPLTHFLSQQEIVDLVKTSGDVFKVGLNGYGEGRVEQLLVQTRPIDYGDPGYCRFEDAVVSVHRITVKRELTAPGDSGAPIFDSQGGIVGLHFAGGLDKDTQEYVSWACTASGIEGSLGTVFPGFQLQLAPGGVA